MVLVNQLVDAYIRDIYLEVLWYLYAISHREARIVGKPKKAKMFHQRSSFCSFPNTELTELLFHMNYDAMNYLVLWMWLLRAARAPGLMRLSSWRKLGFQWWQSISTGSVREPAHATLSSRPLPLTSCENTGQRRPGCLLLTICMRRLAARCISAVW